ncbi:MAG: PilN domain-containing protein [Bacteriovoracaceae bacterium]
MIKINLSNAQKQMDMSNVGGFDFTKIKIKAVGLAIVILYAPDFFLLPMWEQERVDKQQEVAIVNSELTSLKRKITQASELEKQIQDLKEQERILTEKLTVVKQILSEKRNPSNLLIYLAKNIPKDVWITDLTFANDELKLSGESLDYSSIGKFLDSVKSSVFIKEASVTKSESVVREDKMRVERFEINFKIARLNQ